MAVTHSTLRSELRDDAKSIGYASKLATADDHGIAAELNLVRPGNSYEVFRGVIPSYEIINATDPAEWAALSAAERQRYQTITGAGQVDVSNANVRSAFAAMFGAGTTTRAALTALAKRQGSRAEVLFGVGTTVTAADVAAAR